jgi:hypothetical protein
MGTVKGTVRQCRDFGGKGDKMTPDEYAHSIAIAATEVRALRARVERLTDALRSMLVACAPETGDFMCAAPGQMVYEAAREVLGEVGE